MSHSGPAPASTCRPAAPIASRTPGRARCGLVGGRDLRADAGGGARGGTGTARSRPRRPGLNMSRLDVLEHGHPPEVKAELDRAREENGFVSEVAMMLRYRPELFGRPF